MSRTGNIVIDQLNYEETKSKAEIMLYFAEGGEVEYRQKDSQDTTWYPLSEEPKWNFAYWDYRKKPKTNKRPFNSREEFEKALEISGGYIRLGEKTMMPVYYDDNNVAFFYDGDLSGCYKFELKTITYKQLMDEGFTFKNKIPCYMQETIETVNYD